MEDLKALFPSSCRFGTTVDLKMITTNTQLTRIAPIPVCLQEKNWKEE